MRIRNDISVCFLKSRKKWLVRWHGKFNPKTEKQKRFSKTFTIKRYAEKFADSLKIDREDGFTLEYKKITLGKLCKDFIELKKDKSPETVNDYTDTINRLLTEFGEYRILKTISENQARSFINNLQHTNGKETVADYTKLKILKSIKVLFNQAVKWGYIRKSPFSEITLKNLVKDDWKTINPVEFSALLKHTPTLRLRCFYSVMYYCGLRFGEAIHLCWEKNIDFINGKILIKNRKEKDGLFPFRIKNHQDGIVDMPIQVKNMLIDLKKQSSYDNPYLFITDDRLKRIKEKYKQFKEDGKLGDWRNSSMVNNTNRKFVLYCKKAGIVSTDKLSVHCLRKSFGQNLADRGVPMHTLKDLMRHSSIRTTEKFYLKVSDENRKKAVRLLEEMGKEFV